MRSAADWNGQAGYTEFLSLQYSARAPIEEWFAANAPRDRIPPAQCSLLAADLVMLEAPIPTHAGSFALTSDKASLLGAAWVLAGSALGNRSILKEVERTGNDDWPRAFLSDSRMLQFWQALRPELERPASAEEIAASSGAALSVFDHFHSLATQASLQVA